MLCDSTRNRRSHRDHLVKLKQFKDSAHVAFLLGSRDVWFGMVLGTEPRALFARRALPLESGPSLAAFILFLRQSLTFPG